MRILILMRSVLWILRSSKSLRFLRKFAGKFHYLGEKMDPDRNFWWIPATRGEMIEFVGFWFVIWRRCIFFPRFSLARLVAEKGKGKNGFWFLFSNDMAEMRFIFYLLCLSATKGCIVFVWFPVIWFCFIWIRSRCCIFVHSEIRFWLVRSAAWGEILWISRPKLWFFFFLKSREMAEIHYFLWHPKPSELSWVSLVDLTVGFRSPAYMWVYVIYSLQGCQNHFLCCF